MACYPLKNLIGGIMESLNEIFKKFRALAIHESRNIHDEYYEIVIYNKEIDQWEKMLTEVLGTPIKPKGIEPNADHIKITKKSGVIRTNQTLLSKNFDNSTVIAKLWPWDDDTHTTLKMALLVI
jgi:hypothetical protein